MPTRFSRRYMRAKVGTTEKVVGVFILLVLAGVVAAFVIQSAGNKDYLFRVDEGAAGERERARELAVARQMLPALGDPAWRASGQAEVIAADDLPAALGADAADLVDFAVRWVYRRRYETVAEPRRALTVLVCDVVSPERAFGLCRARRIAGAEPLSVGRGGWSASSEGGGARAGFWNGRYYTELRASGASATTAALAPAASAIAAVQLSYGGPFRAEELPPREGRIAETFRAGQTEGPFPHPGIEGWRAPREVFRYTPDNLYIKIDGRAGLYLQFHVVGMLFGTYYHQSDSGRTIDAYWYDMGKPPNAFGIYRAEAPADAVPALVGRQGYQTGGAVFYWKGSSYVQVLPSGADEADARVALEIARRIGAGIAASDEPLWASTVLPESGRVVGSLAYLAQNAFSLEFLNEVFTADYDVEGGRLKLFIHRASDEAAAEALLNQYVAFFEKYGEVIERNPDASRRPMVVGLSGGLVDVVFVKGRYLGGVAGATDAEAARKAAVAFYDGLSVP